MTSQLSFGSLFSGIGGFDLGLERAGWECKWQVENDKFCREILNRHWPDVPKFGDITTIDFSGLGRVDLVCGGFPCQPWSKAGPQHGSSDSRNLWPETISTIRAVRPRYVLLENVPQLLRHDYFGTILGDLAQEGYDAEWDVLSAWDFGAVHVRKRLFIIAYPIGDRRQSILPDSLPERETVSNKQWDSARETGSQQRLEPWLIEALSLYNWGMADADFRGMDDGVPGWMDRYKALGNAVTVPVAEWIGRRIKAYDLI